MNEEKKVTKAGRSAKSAPSKGVGTLVEVFYRDGSVEQFRAAAPDALVSYALDLKSVPPVLSISGSAAGEVLVINFVEVRRFATF